MMHGTCLDDFVHTLKSPISTEIPLSLKNSSRGHGTGFGKKEILFLPKVFICTSTDPIIGTSQTENHFSRKFLTSTISRLQITTCRMQLSKIMSHSPHKLSTLWRAILINSSASSAEICWDWGTIQNYIRWKFWDASWKVDGKYEEEMKEKSGAPKEFSKYLDAFMWLKGEPKFWRYFLKCYQSSPDDASIGGN